jgi:phosphoribosylglycinamide formyltransferase 1
VDEGPAIGSAEIDVRPGDTEDALAARLLKAEHLLYPRCVAAVARGGEARVREDVVMGGDTIRLFAPR